MSENTVHWNAFKCIWFNALLYYLLLFVKLEYLHVENIYHAGCLQLPFLRLKEFITKSKQRTCIVFRPLPIPTLAPSWQNHWSLSLRYIFPADTHATLPWLIDFWGGDSCSYFFIYAKVCDVCASHFKTENNNHPKIIWANTYAWILKISK